METQEKYETQTGTLTEGRGGKYLTFSLAGQEYGIGILKVREIIGMMPITAIPQAPSYVRGVINLRGKVIPIVDFRLKFGMEAVEQTDQTCIIVVGIEGSGEITLIGAVVDSVSEVLHVKEGDIESSPAFGVDTNTDFILGMAKINQGVKILLDIDKILNVSDLRQMV